MAVLNDLLLPIQDAMDEANEQLRGFIPAVNIDGKLSGASKNEEIEIYDVDVAEPSDYTASMTIPEGSEATTTSSKVKIEEVKSTSFNLAGETEMALNNQGKLVSVNQIAFTKAFIKLQDYIEAYLAKKILESASRATGTVGKVPFDTAADFTDLAQLGLIFDDNGTPAGSRELVLNNVAMSNIRAKMSNLFKVNESGSGDLLHNGVLSAPLQGFNLFQSGALKTHKKGTGASYLLSKAAATGDTVLNIDTGTGTILAGDVVTIGSDTNKYLVNKGTTAAGSIVIGNPGLISASANKATVMVGSDYIPSVAFQRDTVLFGARAPAIGARGDAAIDRTYVMSKYGIPFMISVYGGHGMTQVEVSVAYGAGVKNSANVAVLMQ